MAAKSREAAPTSVRTPARSAAKVRPSNSRMTGLRRSGKAVPGARTVESGPDGEVKVVHLEPVANSKRTSRRHANWLAAIEGKWPGDETEAELLAALAEMSKG